MEIFKRTTAKLLLVVGINLLLGTAASVGAQEPAHNKPGCALIDATRRAQFISYEKTVEKEVLLRLHNNTDCPIAVEIDERDQPGAFRTLPNGQHLFVYLRGPHDGIRLSLHYLVQDRPHSKIPVRAYGWGDSVSHYAIPSGQSATFAVPLAFFRKRFDVLVPFVFDWESRDSINMTSGAVAHRVYFLAEELPQPKNNRGQ